MTRFRFVAQSALSLALLILAAVPASLIGSTDSGDKAEKPVTSAMSPSGNPAEDSTMLIRKKAELERKEAELKIKEERLAAVERSIDEKIREYEGIRDKIDAYLKEAKSVQDQDMAQLVKLYESMPPEAAAGRISMLENPLAVKVLKGMKSRPLSKVMAKLDPARAAALSKMMVSR
jgi:flagellar motility protein MotE (MotC chaperone)